MNVTDWVIQRYHGSTASIRSEVERNEASSSRTAPLQPPTTPPELQSLKTGHGGYIEELDLIKAFGRTNFRAYFGIDTNRSTYHAPLSTLALHMRYAHKTPEEVPNMLWEARDKRVGEARKVGNAKTDKEKVGRRWQHESVRESLSVSGKRKRRDVEDAERRVDPSARSVCPPVDLDGSNSYPGRRNSAVVGNRLSSVAFLETGRRREDVPPKQTPQVASPVPSPANEPVPWAQVATPSLLPAHEPVPPPRPSQVAASTSVPVQERDPLLSSSTASSVIATAATLASPATLPQPTASTSTLSAALTAIDECMVQSYQALVQNAPKALANGQEITLKIGKGKDGKYYFENQLRNVRELSLIVV